MFNKSSFIVLSLLAFISAFLITPDYLPTIETKFFGEKKIATVTNKKETKFTYECYEGRKRLSCQGTKREIFFVENKLSSNTYNLEITEMAYDKININDLVEVNFSANNNSEVPMVLNTFLGNKSELQFYLILLVTFCFIFIGYIISKNQKWLKSRLTTILKKNE
jgi:hypothetical protein